GLVAGAPGALARWPADRCGRAAFGARGNPHLFRGLPRGGRDEMAVQAEARARRGYGRRDNVRPLPNQQPDRREEIPALSYFPISLKAMSMLALAPPNCGLTLTT